MGLYKEKPDVDEWLKEAKAEQAADRCGMYLLHNGVVRKTAKALVRSGDLSAQDVEGMDFSYDEQKVLDAVREAETLPGICIVKVWLADGKLNVGDDIMYVLIGGDIRPHVIDALQSLVGKIKNECVCEKELR